MSDVKKAEAPKHFQGTPLYKKILTSKWFQLLVICALLCVGIYMINSGFATRGNIRNLMRGSVVPGIMLVAVGPLLAGGGIDLAAAGQATLGGLVLQMF